MTARPAARRLPAALVGLILPLLFQLVSLGMIAGVVHAMPPLVIPGLRPPRRVVLT